ncbi:MAG: hypothetical protein GYA02_01010, partial [Clostridiaceae bacterium]|nr:hypothetical protein [Clostridiaceae bacterium]
MLEEEDENLKKLLSLSSFVPIIFAVIVSLVPFLIVIIESIASVSFVNYSNYCYITPKNPGTCKIVITHPDSLFEKEVIITVQRKGDGTHIPYITTQKNILTIV